MKSFKYAVTAVVLFSTSPGTFAAESVTEVQAQSMSRMGVVSAGGATTLDELEIKLAKKATKAGASGYIITSARAKNRLGGTAIIYK